MNREIEYNQRQSTPRKLLIEQIMDCRIAKTEREHAACREIEKLREQLDARRAELARDFEAEQRAINAQDHLRADEAELARPESVGRTEPVAWMSQGGDVSRSKKYFVEMGFTDLLPLYTAPPAAPTQE